MIKEPGRRLLHLQVRFQNGFILNYVNAQKLLGESDLMA